jgi:quercetin dioxygenase-like cupin family protein
MTPSGESDERAAVFAAGATPPDEVGALDAALAEAAGFGAVVEELTGAIPPVEPPPDARAKLLAALAPRGAAVGISFRFAADGEFSPTRHPGISSRVLHIDHARRLVTVLLKLEPGAVYPAHSHDGPEECLVLEGEVLVGGVRMCKGDYQRAEPGSEHVVQRSDTGALLFLTAPVSLMEG